MIHRVKSMFTKSEVLRYLIVGGVNTVFGMGLYVLILYILNHVLPDHLFGLKVTQARLAMSASVLSNPINITVSYLNYKFFVFRTRGNYVREWFKALGVYGVSWAIGLVALGALTRFIEVLLHGRTPLGKGTPGYIAGVSMTLVTTIISYIGHKKVTFGGSPGHDEDLAADEVLENEALENS